MVAQGSPQKAEGIKDDLVGREVLCAFRSIVRALGLHRPPGRRADKNGRGVGGDAAGGAGSGWVRAR